MQLQWSQHLIAFGYFEERIDDLCGLLYKSQCNEYDRGVAAESSQSIRRGDSSNTPAPAEGILLQLNKVTLILKE